MEKIRKTNLIATQIEDLTNMYTDPDCTMAEMEAHFGRRPGTIGRWAFELGLKRPKPAGALKLGLQLVRKYVEEISQQIPPEPVVISKEKPVGGARARMIDFVLNLSDLHAGRVTKSFNAAVFGNRMAHLAHRVREKVKMFSLHHQIGKLYIVSAGDLVSGEHVGRQITLEELEHAILTQVYGIAVPRLVQFTNAMLELFKQIDVVAAPGNHGVTQKPAVSAANWDTVVNLSWQAKMSNDERVDFSISVDNWYNSFTARTTDFLVIHGDQARGSNYAGLITKFDQWQTALEEHFDYILCGHFHHMFKARNIFGNGTLASDDEWSHRVVGREGDCMQTLFAVSDRGIEDVMPIWLQDIGEED